MAQVLIVDDDLSVREPLRWLLEDAGFGVTEADYDAPVFNVLFTSAQPMVVLLGDSLDGGVRAALLSAAADYGPLARHTYVQLTSTALGTSAALDRRVQAPAPTVVPTPQGLPALVQLISYAAMRLRLVS
jgi:CheY-like chemotaxis protein